MATRSFIAQDKPDAGAAATILRYQLNVVTATTDDVVRWAGGWLCDRARAGWDVNVMVADGGDPRPLTILGATPLDPDDGFASLFRNSSRGGVLAVSADLLGTDARIRDEVIRTLRRTRAEMMAWGETWPTELGRQADSMQHRMSSAARAFKSYALAAAKVTGDAVMPVETLFRVGKDSFRPLYSV
jgi:hypothetical protein